MPYLATLILVNHGSVLSFHATAAFNVPRFQDPCRPRLLDCLLIPTKNVEMRNMPYRIKTIIVSFVYLANSWPLFLRPRTFVWARGSRTTWWLCSGCCWARDAYACTSWRHPIWLEKKMFLLLLRTLPRQKKDPLNFNRSKMVMQKFTGTKAYVGKLLFHFPLFCFKRKFRIGKLW